MAFNITDFRNSYTNTGEPASPAYYEVYIIGNPTITNTNPNNKFEDFIKYRCISCTMPGIQVNTIDRSTYGPISKIATGVSFQDTTFSFIVSEDMSELRYFSYWMAFISNTIEGNDVNTLNNVEYYNNYVAKVIIKQFGKSGNLIRNIELLDAYPTNISAVSLGWDLSNEIIRLDITMTYRVWIPVIGDSPVAMEIEPKLATKPSTLGNRGLDNNTLAPNFNVANRPSTLGNRGLDNNTLAPNFIANGGRFGGGGATGNF